MMVLHEEFRDMPPAKNPRREPADIQWEFHPPNDPTVSSEQ